MSIINEITSKIYEETRADKLLIPYLKNKDSVVVVSIGKAANEMCKAVYDSYDVLESLIICPYSSIDYKLANNERICASHPMIDSNSLIAGEKLIKFVCKNKKNKIQFLISGGGSSLVEKLSNIDICEYNKCVLELMKKGADINEINCIRKHLSDIKGGNLLKYLQNNNHQTYILCDIIDNNYQNVSSGLTFSDSNYLIDAIEILKKYQLDKQYSKYLKETPKDVKSVDYVVIGDNIKLLKIIHRVLNDFNINSEISKYKLCDLASITGLNIGCQIFKYCNKKIGKFAIIYGGETVVEIRGDGKGGRALELALATSIEIQGLKNVMVVSSSTDGKDGNCEAAGVIIDGNTYSLLKRKGLSPEKFLRNNDSYSALVDVAEIIPAFQSGSNLNDFVIVFFNM